MQLILHIDEDEHEGIFFKRVRNIIDHERVKLPKVSFLKLFKKDGIDNRLYKGFTYKRTNNEITKNQKRASKTCYNPALISIINDHDRSND